MGGQISKNDFVNTNRVILYKQILDVRTQTITNIRSDHNLVLWKISDSWKERYMQMRKWKTSEIKAI